MHPAIVYTLCRILLLAVSAGVLYLLGLRHPLYLMVGAFLVSGVASYVLLSKQRDAMSARIARNRE
ncbi:hypothetical protein GCM10010156_46430 [Planobispora rosea]|uniref:DUF4229 domain-containing protein n=1 Tax=Planobispora rosea TaxID=35762 RepID=A0A8J3WCW3_PLARO|nr:DUF4229 domain-containing protein [Planobispora rosea]GGS82476.1 hypothetical protein GCM10010156_46430 [Planobispora rosea]GIH84242.1 hypothetical protein Pro02_26500 [Planobispora rosea]